MKKLIEKFATTQNLFVNFVRFSVFIVMVWIGGLKAFQYEADGIVPFVANSPLMNYFYHNSGKTQMDNKGNAVPEYSLHKNPEGLIVQKNIDWHKQNGTYTFSYGLGTVIVLIGIMVFLGIWFPRIGFWSGLLTFGMSIVTLSFLVTTPEVYVPALGGDFPTPRYGFPYLSGAGRLVIKDVIMMTSGLVIASDSAKKILTL